MAGVGPLIWLVCCLLPPALTLLHSMHSKCEYEERGVAYFCIHVIANPPLSPLFTTPADEALWFPQLP